MKLASYLHPQLIFFPTPVSKEELLHRMVEDIAPIKQLAGKEIFYQALIDRERVVSTGIGMAVAIPHAKIPHAHTFFIAIAIAKQGIDWNSLDGAPARLIFLIGGPPHKQTEYLKLLSALTLAIRDEGLRRNMLAAESPEEVLQLLENL